MSGANPQADQSPDRVEPPAAGDGGTWHRIREHKIIQWALGYLAAGLALTHAEELIAHAFEWPEFISRALIVVLALGLPIAITLAWYHGHRASRHVTGAEATIIAILLLIGSGLLLLLARPHESAVTRSVLERAAAPASSPVPSAAVPLTPASTAALLVRAPASGKPRIAILPFENLSPDPANAFFTDGMHEEVLTALSNSAPGVEVISRTTMMSYKGKPVTVEQVVKDLGATHVLEGSLRRQGDHVRVTLQLIDGATDNHVWSKDYDRTLSDALTLQSEIAAAVADKLSVTVLQAAERAMPPTSNARAYDLYLKALLSSPGTIAPAAAYVSTDNLLKQALALDPSFALAHCLRADLQGLLFMSNRDVSEEGVKLWRSELDAAVKLAPDDPRILSAEGDYAYEIDRDLGAALYFYEQVDSKGLISPGALAGKYAVLLALGRIDDTIALGRRTLQADPQNLASAIPAVFGLWVAHRTPEVLHAILTGPSRFTPLPAMAKWYFKGELDPGLPFLQTRDMKRPGGMPDDVSPRLFFEFARYSGRLSDFKASIDAASVDAVRMDTFVMFPIPGIGSQPLADFRGWTDLLLGDKAGAEQQSKPILDFLAKNKETKWNIWFLRILRADAELFAGNSAAGVTSAKEAMTFMPCTTDAMRCLYPQLLGAQVLAWAGDEEEAVALLEKLSFDVPGIAPAHAARDPMFTIPLAHNARYKTLKTKLEMQMAATKLE